MGCYEASGEEVFLATPWSYSHAWRPMGHIAQIQSYAGQSTRTASRRPGAQQGFWSGLPLVSTAVH
jgi:hypothetical protein